jgi:hypothetical protein
MRTVEIALLLVPVALVVAWLCGIRGLSRRGAVAAILGLGIFACLLFWLGTDRSFTGPYVPARLSGTRVEPGHPE